MPRLLWLRGYTALVARVKFITLYTKKVRILSYVKGLPHRMTPLHSQLFKINFYVSHSDS